MNRYALIILAAFFTGCGEKKTTTHEHKVVNTTQGSHMLWVDEEKVMSSFPEYVKAKAQLTTVLEKLQKIREKASEIIEKDGKNLAEMKKNVDELAKKDVSKAAAQQKTLEVAQEALKAKLLPLQKEAIQLEHNAADAQHALNDIIIKLAKINEAALQKIISSEDKSVSIVLGMPGQTVLYIDDKIDRTSKMIEILNEIGPKHDKSAKAS